MHNHSPGNGSAGQGEARKSIALDNFLTRQEFCQQLGITYRTAEIWAHKGIGPKVTRLAGRAYYAEADIQEWTEAQRQKASARFATKGA